MNDTEFKNLFDSAIRSARLARLIAQDAINVEYSSEAKTSSFNHATRTITIPYNVMMGDEDIEMLFIFREVGKYLYSGSRVSKASRRIVSAEEIRVEEIIRQKYPGATKHLTAGYKKLLDKGVLGNKEEINLMPSYIRAELYYKLGIKNGAFIQLEKSDYEFIEIAKMSTSASEMGAALGEYVGESYDSWKKRYWGIAAKHISADDTESEDSYEDNEAYVDSFDPSEYDVDGMVDDGYIATPNHHSRGDEYVTNCGGRDAASFLFDNDVSEATLKATYDRLMATESVATLIEENTQPNQISNFTVYPYQPAPKDIVNYISADEYLSLMTDSNRVQLHAAMMGKFRTSNKKNIDSMARVFDTKKAAVRRKNSKISETGILNIDRVAGYRYNDDIFMKAVETPDAKNHGFIILLDCSGSIHSAYQSMVKQVVSLVDFFRRIGVKYKVFGYGARINDETILPRYKNITMNANGYGTKTYMIEFMNSTMSNAVHTKACTAISNPDLFSLGSTPTINALYQAEHIAMEFLADVQIRKMIVITDGAPDTEYSDVFGGIDRYSRYDKKLVFDEATRKSYPITKSTAYLIPDLIGAIYKDRHNIDMISIAINNSGSPTKNIGNFVNSEPETKTRYYVEYTSDQGNKVYGSTVPEIVDTIDNLNLNSASSVNDAKKEFSKALATGNQSRVFLNVLAEYVSVEI